MPIRRTETTGLLFVAPAFVWLATLLALPLVLSVWLSLTSTTAGAWGGFVGLANYRRLLDSQIFVRTVQNSLVFAVASIALKTVLGLAVALLLSTPLPARRFFRSVTLLPWIAPAPLSMLAWLWIFDPIYGVANNVLKRLGLIALDVPWLSSPGWALASVILANVWRGTPFFVITILAGLVSVPPELYEPARIEGATRWQQLRHITLPLIRPVLVVVILFSLIMTISDFQIVYILTNGGPANSTHLFATFAYQTGMVGGNVGEGAAILLFMAPFLALLIYLQLHLRERVA